MIHFFGIFEPAHPRADADSEAPFKRRSFGEAMFGQGQGLSDFSPAERDNFVLSGKAPVSQSEREADTRFVALAFPPYL